MDMVLSTTKIEHFESGYRVYENIDMSYPKIVP